MVWRAQTGEFVISILGDSCNGGHLRNAIPETKALPRESPRQPEVLTQQVNLSWTEHLSTQDLDGNF